MKWPSLSLAVLQGSDAWQSTHSILSAGLQAHAPSTFLELRRSLIVRISRNPGLETNTIVRPVDLCVHAAISLSSAGDEAGSDTNEGSETKTPGPWSSAAIAQVGFHSFVLECSQLLTEGLVL
jgi:hypothetical protein